MTLFGDMYTKAINFFVLLRFTPSKDILARVITSLFPECKRTFVYKNRIEYTCYNGLVERCKISTDDTPILIPNECEAGQDRLGHLTITCPTLHVVNGNIVTCTMTFGKTTCLMVRGASLHIQQQIDLTQSNVDGLVYLCEKLKLCKGMRCDENFVTSKNSVKEDWSRFCNETQIDQRVRSSVCKVILSLTSKVELCEACRCSLHSHKKRKAEVVDDACIVSDMKKSEDDVITLVETPSVKFEPNVMVAEPPDEMLTSNVVTEPDKLHKIITFNDVPESFNSLLESQLRNNKNDKDPRHRRWNPDIISLSLSLYCRSPCIYQDLKSSGFLTLPSKRLLQYYKNSVKQQPGYVDENLTWMVREADRQKISEFGKHGGILIDEMTIPDDLQISKEGDTWKLVGAVDMGEINNRIDVIMNGQKKIKFATHVFQLIFHGFTGFRWPIAYFASETATAHQIFQIVWEGVDKLDDRGFIVDYIMMDGASTNRSFSSMLFTGDPREEGYMTKNMYDASHRICIIQDVMHVLKKIRNNLESSKSANEHGSGRFLSMVDGSVIIWDHFTEAFKFNFQGGFRLHRKLSKEHLELTTLTKMRNSLAIDVLGKEMLYLMRSYQASLTNQDSVRGTVHLLQQTSKITEVFCDKNRSITDISDPRLGMLHEVLSFFNTWEKTVSESTILVPQKHLMSKEARDDLNSSLMGFISLCRQHVGNGRAISPGFFNSDLIENFFCQQRGIKNGLNTNPTIQQYGPSVNSICLGQRTVSSKSNSILKASYFSATVPGALNAKSKSLRGAKLRV